MPYVSATLRATASDDLTARAISALTDLTVEVLGKDGRRKATLRGETIVITRHGKPGLSSTIIRRAPTACNSSSLRSKSEAKRSAGRATNRNESLKAWPSLSWVNPHRP